MHPLIKWLFIMLWTGWTILVVPPWLLPFMVGASVYALVRVVREWRIWSEE
jgi:hypothetical protein